MSSKSELNPNLKWIMEEMSERYGNLAELPKELPESFREKKIIFLFDEISYGKFMDSQPSLELSTAPRVLNPAAFAVAEERLASPRRRSRTTERP